MQQKINKNERLPLLKPELPGSKVGTYSEIPEFMGFARHWPYFFALF